MLSFTYTLTIAILATLAELVTTLDNSWPIKDSGYTNAVQWDHYSFFINGERKFLFGGEMHPFRVPVPEMWQDVIQKIKASGMNTMSFYSMWGLHESFAGELDFTTASRDLNRLLEFAEDSGLYVMARPGPYVNAELSAGGLPLWLTTGEYGTLRSNGTSYTMAWEGYMSKVADLIDSHQIHKNGTVIAYQIENEYNSQFSDRTTKTIKYSSVNYMEKLEATIREHGIDVPSTHNAPGKYGDWSTDFDTVGAGGDVNIWGQDSYPLCWSCNPDDCSSANDEFVLLDYYEFFQSVAPTQPGLMPEFQGGRVVSLGADECANSLGPDFRNVYYRHNIDQKISALMLYMVAGGTNWGWIGVPFIGSSYDYSAPIAEDRTLRDSWYETKSLALFTRVAKDLSKVDRIGQNTSYTDNEAVSATELRNPDTDAAFYVVRHATSTDNSSETYHLNIRASIGNITIPQVLDGALLQGHISKIITTDFAFANQTLIYSTAEILTFAIFDELPTIALWLPAGESGEFLLKDAKGGAVLNCDGCSNVNFTQVNSGTIVSFRQDEGATVLEVGNTRVLILDRSAAWKTFVPALSRDPAVPEDETVIVRGPYLIREAAILEDGALHLHGDTNTTTELEVFTKGSVSKLWWNGKSVSAKKTGYGSLVTTLDGPDDYELPKLTGWRTQPSLPERFVNYSATSEAWVDATTNDDLYVDLYGPHYGYSLWRGTFNGSASGGYFDVQGGVGFGFSIYLNGALVGYFPGDVDSANAGIEVSFENATVNTENSNLIFIIQDNTGHDELSRALNPRGILNATLVDSNATIQWKLAGTAGSATNTTLDPVRSPYNEGGLMAERLGWHLPGFDDSNWPEGSPSDGLSEATVQFYRTTVTLDVPDGHDMSVIFNLASKDGETNEFRSLLFVNGYQYGRYMPYVSSTASFPVLPGILNYGGKNTIAVALWTQRPTGVSLEVDWEISKITRSSLNTKFDGSDLRPEWTSGREIYA